MTIRKSAHPVLNSDTLYVWVWGQMLQLKQDFSKDVTCGLKSKWSEVATTKGAQESISGKG